MARPAAGWPALIGWRLAHLPALLLAAAATLVAAAAVGWLARGGAGAVGAAVGVAVATASYLVSTLVIAWADAVRPALVLPLGLATYLVKLTVIGAVMIAIAASGWDGLVPMALGVVAGAVGWSAAQVWWVVRRSDNGPGDANSPYRARMGGQGVHPERGPDG
jgi:hypothetical protein